MDTDKWIVTLKCNNDICNDQKYREKTATATTNGAYTASIVLDQGGTYDIVVRMKNDATRADANIDTIVSTGTTITVIDNATVASTSTLETSPTVEV